MNISVVVVFQGVMEQMKLPGNLLVLPLPAVHTLMGRTELLTTVTTLTT